MAWVEGVEEAMLGVGAEVVVFALADLGGSWCGTFGREVAMEVVKVSRIVLETVVEAAGSYILEINGTPLPLPV